jgi:PAS domain-containing protein
MKSGALDYIIKSSESMMDMPHIAERAIERWQTQVTLAERDRQFRLLAENSSDIISRHDIEGNFLYVSPA